jgi:3-hydroxyisobutyrate dehydrogenase-like beta-hydroxyacid dehydrogenase
VPAPASLSTVGIVSPGAMGAALGMALGRGGARVVATISGRSARTAALADGLELLDSLDAVVAECDLLLSVVPPGQARAVGQAVREAAERTGASPLVADLNAIAPEGAHAIATALGAAGLELVDGAISGPPPRPEATTRIYLSGAHAGAVASLHAPGVAWRVVGDEIGSASAVKMSTASVYKGTVALLLQALRSAHANAVLEPVLDDLREAFPELVDGASGTVQRAASKAHRYVGEMREIAATQEAAGLTPDLFEALAAIYRDIAATPLGALPPEDADPARALDGVLDEL